MRPSTTARAGLPDEPQASQLGTTRLHLLPPVLLVLAVLDLRTELLLLFDHFTLTSVLTAILAHPLAVVVLLAQPSLWRHYHGGRR